MARIEVKYNASEFIEACFGEGIEEAREYVAQNPKESYGCDDFAEVHRWHEWKKHKKTGPDNHYYDDNFMVVGVGTWAEDDFSFLRAVEIYEAD